MGFIQLNIDKEHPWYKEMIMDVHIPPGILIVSLVRDKRPIAPNGHTIIEDGDILILSALAVSSDITTELTELKASSKQIGKKIYELDFEKGKLVILIKRGNEIIIPDGNTIIEKDDQIVINNTMPK